MTDIHVSEPDTLRSVCASTSERARMKGQILVLGAAGRLGFAAAEAFRDAGWSVKGLVRPDAAWRAPKGIDVIETNDRAVAVKEARGTDIVLHALNAPYPGWAQHALPLAYSAIEAAEQSGATLMFPGNVYNYGAGMPAVLDEDDADAADLAQGQDPQRDRAAAARSIRPRHAHDRAARRRFLRPRTRLVVRPRADQGTRQEQDHLSGPARRRARMGLPA